MQYYAAKCPKCGWASSIEAKEIPKLRLSCRKCGKSTKYFQYPRDGKPPFEAFYIKGPYDIGAVPKAVAAWNRRTFGPDEKPPQDRPMEEEGEKLDRFME